MNTSKSYNKFNGPSLPAVMAVGAAIGISAVGLLHNLISDNVDGVRNNAANVEQDLVKQITNGERIKLVPGIVSISDANLRDLPAVVNTNNAAMIDGIATESGNFVITRPLLLENSRQLNNTDPKYWLAGYDPRQGPSDFDGAEGLVFYGLTPDTMKHLTYYIKNGQKGANICPDGVTGVFETQVSYEDGGATINSDGFSKNVGLVQDLTDASLQRNVIDTLNYHASPAC